MTIRPATAGDVPELHAMICELAVFERLGREVEASEGDTRRALFGEPPAAEALIAECDGAAAGFAIFYPYYSTFAGQSCLYLEDLYIRESFRRRGIGRALTGAFLEVARGRGCPKVEWRVLRWNAGALEFYRSLGADVLDDWVPVRLAFRPTDQ